jgi:hypothetical protein
MDGTVVEFPRLDVERAREIVASPDLYSGREIVRACEVLFARGNRADVHTVLALQRAGIVAGFERAAAAEKRADRRRNWEMLLGFYLLFASIVGTVAIAGWLARAIGVAS